LQRFLHWSSGAWDRRCRERASAVELSYSRGSEGRKEDVCYAIPLSWTPCNFGGSRPWFDCPGVVNEVPCGRRVAKLYLKGRYFLCRHCQDLGYSSQQEAQWHATLRRCQRIRQKLGGTANMTEPFPGKPKGMHLRTYLRLAWEVRESPRGVRPGDGRARGATH
jgi:hypothetical protein